MSHTKFVVETLLFLTKKNLPGSEVDNIVKQSLTFFQRLLHRLLLLDLFYSCLKNKILFNILEFSESLKEAIE
jgi:hypothetical protein